MASCITSQWANYSPQIQLTVTGVNASSTIHRLSWTLQYVGHGYAPRTTGGRAYNVVIAGETVANGSYDINGKSGTYTIASGTKDISRDYSNKTISFSLSFAFNLTWSGVYSGTRTASGSMNIPARPSNQYTFNANGGSGAPGAITKWGGVDFTFPNTRPSRIGYTFKGWNNTTINNGALYQPGQTVGGLPDQSIEWWANWQANTYTVTYNANGGSGAPGKQTKTYGVTLKLSSTIPSRTNYSFKGWGTSSGSSTVAYAAGANYTANSSITLYAIWQLNYRPPSITSISVERCNSSGTLNDEGTYAKVSFSWSVDSTTNGVSSITIGYRPTVSPGTAGGTIYTNVSVSASGKSGSVSKVIGGGFNTESSYDVRITVTDNKGSSYVDRNVSPTSYLIDFSPGGGIAIGKPAEKVDLFEVDYKTQHNKVVKNTAGSYVYSSNYLNSSAKYIRIAKISTVSAGAWNNSPIWIRIVQRNYTIPTDICIAFENVSTTDPNINQFYFIGQGLFEAYMAKESTSVWGLYIKKSEDNDSICVISYSCDYEYKAHDITWDNTQTDSLPSNRMKATNFNADIVGAYQPRNHNHGYVTSIGNCRFANDWVGFYANASDAINSANRKGWIGYDGTNTFKLTNEKAGFEIRCGSTAMGIEIYHPSQAFLDFHNGNSSADRTHRLLCQTGSNIIAYPGVTNGSDRRWKKDEEIMNPIFLNVLKRLQTKTFRFIKADKNLRIGFIAQDVLEAMKDENIDDIPIVQQNEEDGFYGIDYGQITSLLVAGWQEHEKTITELNTEISILKEEINDLKDIIGELKSMVKGDE